MVVECDRLGVGGNLIYISIISCLAEKDRHKYLQLYVCILLYIYIYIYIYVYIYIYIHICTYIYKDTYIYT